MFHSIDDTSCLFEDYKLSPEELNSCRKRLLAIDPYLCIAKEEGQSENEDWADVFYFVGDEKRIICIVPNWYEVNVPQVFVLSDEHDYEMDDKSLFDFLTYIYEKKPGLKLSNKQFMLDDETHSHTGLIYYVACYLTAVPKESEIYNSYDKFCNRGQWPPVLYLVFFDEIVVFFTSRSPRCYSAPSKWVYRY